MAWGRSGVRVPSGPLMEKLISRERDGRGVRVVIIQGMADLPGWANGLVKKFLGACELYDPRWSNGEGLEKKLKGLERSIGKASCSGGPVVLVGISAGAGLAMEYMLRNPNKIRHLFSVGGVLSPNENSYKEITKKVHMESPGFKEMTEDLAGRLREPSGINRTRLRNMVTAYSAKIEDGIVPRETSEPEWARVVRIGGRGHVRTIGLALLTDVRDKLIELEGNGLE